MIECNTGPTIQDVGHSPFLMNNNYWLVGSQAICYIQIEHRVQFGYHGTRNLNEGHVGIMYLDRYEGIEVWA